MQTPNTSTWHGLLPLSLLVALLAMLAPFSIDTYLPSFPDIALEFSASTVQMQQTLGFYLLAFAFSTLMYGPLSDGLGRKPVAIGVMLLYTFSSIGCALSEDIHQLIAWRIAQGFSASAGLVLGRAMVRDCYHGAEAQQVMARMMLLFSVAPAAAPIIGGLLHDAWGWRSVFWFLTVMGGSLAVILMLGASETHPREYRHSIHPVKVAASYKTALSHRYFMGLVISFALMFAGMFLYLAGSPYIIYQHLQLGTHDFWVLFAPVVIGLIIGSTLAGRLAGRIPPIQVVQAGFAVMLIAATLNILQALILEPAPWNIVGPPTLYVIGMTMSLPNVSLMALDFFPRNRGMASALQSFIQMGFSALVVALIVPRIADSIPALTMAMFLLICCAFALWLLIKKGIPEHSA